MGVEEHVLPTEEVPPASSGWIANKFAQIWFRLDAIMHHMKNERGPDPDADWEDSKRDLRDLIQQATREGARRATIEIDTYHEGGGGSWKDTSQKVLVGLMILGIGGTIAMYAKVASLESKVDSLQSQFHDLQRLVEPRYRGGE
jgi:hypothetical protein